MNAVQMSGKLYECRDAAKTLLGEHYRPAMALLATAIKGEAKSRGCNDLQAAIAISKEAYGFQTILILAAAVEMIEPEPAC